MKKGREGGYVVIHKKRGETPLEAMENWKAGKSELTHSPVSYAGRLDPMAEGKVLVLFGDECKKQTQYTKLDKEYEVEVLLDFSSDTGDVLGLGSYSHTEIHPGRQEVLIALQKEKGTHSHQYPAFSSKTVKGKPLFLYTLEGTIHDIEIPVHDETIYNIQLLGIETVSADALLARIQDMLAYVSRAPQPSKALGADFRQDAIRTRWNEIFAEVGKRDFSVIKLRVTCASGTYMRTLAERIGASLGTQALALSINRTKIGKYSLLPFFGFWKQELT